MNELYNVNLLSIAYVGSLGYLSAQVAAVASPFCGSVFLLSQYTIVYLNLRYLSNETLQKIGCIVSPIFANLVTMVIFNTSLSLGFIIAININAHIAFFTGMILHAMVALWMDQNVDPSTVDWVRTQTLIIIAAIFAFSVEIPAALLASAAAIYSHSVSPKSRPTATTSSSSSVNPPKYGDFSSSAHSSSGHTSYTQTSSYSSDTTYTDSSNAADDYDPSEDMFNRFFGVGNQRRGAATGHHAGSVPRARPLLTEEQNQETILKMRELIKEIFDIVSKKYKEIQYSKERTYTQADVEALVKNRDWRLAAHPDKNDNSPESMEDWQNVHQKKEQLEKLWKANPTIGAV